MTWQHVVYLDGKEIRRQDQTPFPIDICKEYNARFTRTAFYDATREIKYYFERKEKGKGMEADDLKGCSIDFDSFIGG